MVKHKLLRNTTYNILKKVDLITLWLLITYIVVNTINKHVKYSNFKSKG
jgi:hypothetical protein